MRLFPLAPLLVFLLCFAADVKAQVPPTLFPNRPITGKYQFENLRPESLFESNFNTIGQDSKGLIYSGSEDTGIMIYDGANWHGPHHEFVTATSAIAFRPPYFYWGGTNNFGFYLTKNNQPYLLNHNNEYTSLANMLDNKENYIGRVQKIIPLEEEVLFITDSYLIKYSHLNKKISILGANLPELRVTKMKNSIWIWDAINGLRKILQNELIPLTGGQHLATLKVQKILAIGTDRILLSTYDKGLFLFADQQLRPFSASYNKAFIDSPVGDMEMLIDYSIAIGTKDKGIIIISQQGEILEVFDEEYGLTSNQTNDLFIDQHNWLWMATPRGFSTIEYPAALSYLDEDYQLYGQVNAMVEHQQKLYVATSEGLFFIPLHSDERLVEISPDIYRSVFTKVTAIPSACWSLSAFDETLLVASSNGVYQQENAEFKKINSDSTNALFHSKQLPSRVYAGTNNGLYVLEKKDGEWQQAKRVKKLRRKINRMIEDDRGLLWLGTDNGCWKIPISNTKDTIKQFARLYITHPEHRTISEYTGKLNPLLYQGIPIFQNGGFWYYDLQKDSVYKPTSTSHDPIKGAFFTSFSNSGSNYFSIFEKYGVVDRDSLNYSAPYSVIFDQNGDTLRTKGGDYRWVKEIRRENGFDIAYYTSDSIFFFYSGKKLFVHNQHPKGKPFDLFYKTIIRNVEYKKDIYSNPSNFKSAYSEESDSFKTVFSYSNNNIRFEFSSIGVPAGNSNIYTYTLYRNGEIIHFDSESPYTYCLLSQLKEGKYLFKVIAYCKIGRVNHLSKEAVFAFTILPPWYRTYWAYITYAILSLFFLYRLYRFFVWRALEKAETARIKELDTLKTRLYTNITHEFRTPLTVILGMTQQIQSHPDQWLGQGLQLIKRNGQLLLHLVSQLLDLSKLESGNMQLKMVQGNIVPLVKYTFESFHSLAESKRVKLHFLSDIDALIMDHDPSKLMSILSNLISNALKFTSQGGDIYLQLAVQASIEKNTSSKQLQFKIKDTGIGISKAALPHIFDRFYQVDDTHQRSGSGVGLAITKELIHLMKGRIEVESQLNKGTTFTITLPVQNQAAIHTDPIKETVVQEFHSSSVIEGNKTALNINNRTVIEPDQAIALVIEDNQDVVVYLHSCLADRYHVQMAYDGKSGLEKAKAIIPDIIICDIMMPLMNGLEVCGQLKKDHRTSHIPVILLTAKADHASKIEGLDRGADAYLTKPFNKEELFVRIKKLIELRKELQKRYTRFNYTQLAQNKRYQQEDNFLNRLTQVIDEHLSESDFKMPHFYRAMRMSKAQFFRKVKSLTGQPPSHFIRAHRLLRAKELLLTTNLSITEVAYDVGFSEISTFSRYFKETFGLSPSETRKHL